MRRISLALAGALVISVASLILLTRPPGSIERGPPSGEITIAYPNQPLTLDPYSEEGDSIATRDLLRPVLPTLLRLVPDGAECCRYAPHLATRVPTGKDITRDPFSVSFQLDRRAKWSDGRPITSADIAFTHRYVTGTSSRASQKGEFARVKRVEARGAHRVRLVFDRAHPGWRDYFSAGSFILPAHAWRRGMQKPPVAGGPFTIERVTRGLEVVYRANPRWWGPSARTARVRVQFVPVFEIALRLLGEPRIDALVSTTQINLRRRVERQRARVATAYGYAWWELAVRADGGIDRPGERTTLARAIDIPGIVEALIRDEGRPLNDVTPQVRANVFQRYPFDASADFGGEELSISAPAESEVGQILEKAVVAALEEAGASVEVKDPPENRFYGRWLRGDEWDLAVWERRGGPSESLAARFHSRAWPPGGRNYQHSSAQEIDRAIDDLEGTVVNETYDPGLRAVAMDALASYVPVFPLFESALSIGHLEVIRGPEPNASVEGPFWNLSEWFRTPAE